MEVDGMAPFGPLAIGHHRTIFHHIPLLLQRNIHFVMCSSGRRVRLWFLLACFSDLPLLPEGVDALAMPKGQVLDEGLRNVFKLRVHSPCPQIGDVKTLSKSNFR